MAAPAPPALLPPDRAAGAPGRAQQRRERRVLYEQNLALVCRRSQAFKHTHTRARVQFFT